MLTETQLKQISELQHLCEVEDGIHLKLNSDMLQTRGEEINDFFHYEDGQLVGFLGLYPFGSKAELCGMVSPAYRKKGIFSILFKSALKTIDDRKFTKVLLNTPGNSLSGKGFLQTLPCEYAFTEFQMKWEESNLVMDDSVTLRRATADDLELRIQLDVQSFGVNEDDARDYNTQTSFDDEKQFYIIEANDERVGKIRVSYYDGEAWIYGFSILPKYQGKGIGRKALSRVVINEHKKGYPIFLEVEAKNNHALKLYESCGFHSFYSQDYYDLKL